MNLPKKVANILLEGLGEEYEGESLLKSSEFGDGAYTCRENTDLIRMAHETEKQCGISSADYHFKCGIPTHDFQVRYDFLISVPMM